jgi:hypothetical protein
MNNFAILEVFTEYDFVTYYTVRLVVNDIEADLNETDKFYEKCNDPAHSHHGEFCVIVDVIDAMGSSVLGAQASLFRFEEAANALPPPVKEADKLLDIQVPTDSELRLYCMRITDEVVILINGEVKTENNALSCPNVKSYFRFAQSVAKAVDKLINEGSIRIDGKRIINEAGDEEIILYL